MQILRVGDVEMPWMGFGDAPRRELRHPSGDARRLHPGVGADQIGRPIRPYREADDAEPLWVHLGKAGEKIQAAALVV